MCHLDYFVQALGWVSKYLKEALSVKTKWFYASLGNVAKS
jgi:hypothetical protein